MFLVYAPTLTYGSGTRQAKIDGGFLANYLCTVLRVQNAAEASTAAVRANGFAIGLHCLVVVDITSLIYFRIRSAF